MGNVRTAAELMAYLNRDALEIARAFGLRFRALEPERRNVRRRYGICYADGTIKIRLFHATTGRPLRYSSLVDTLCHELAHLRHFDHGPRFQAFYRRILGHARRQGIYRPRAPLPAAARVPAPPLRRPETPAAVPIQLALF
jgi:predicted metal-dependent hydrolase